MRCLALDIGGTKIAAALVENNQTQQCQQITTPQTDANAMHDALAKLICDYTGQFDYIAVASTGIINKGILTALNPKNLGGLAQFPLQESMARHTDKPIFLLNDVQAAAYAEYQIQDKANLSNFAFITVSTGVGGGIILDGELQIGPNGIVGHIGHTLADPQGDMCGCGRRGCVEAVAAGRAIERIAQSWDTPCSPKEVFALFRKNEPKATALVKRSASAIANLIADLVISLDIQQVVLGGSVGLAEGYLPLVQQYIDKMPSFYHCHLSAALYGTNAGLIGAASWGERELNNCNDKES